MGAQQRVFRRRIRTVQATKKITKAMELISASRIMKAQARLEGASPYTRELVRAVSAAASHASGVTKHPLIAQPDVRRRAAVLVIGSDRGLAGAYSSNAIKEAEALIGLLRSEGVEAVPFTVGRKPLGYYRFRDRPVGGSWTGFTEQPHYEHAMEVAQALLSAYNTPTDDGGVDEIHMVFTRFVNTVVQTAEARRILPLDVVDEVVDAGVSAGEAAARRAEGAGADAAARATAEANRIFPLYEFEPGADAVLDGLLPQYVTNVIYTAMLNAATSEHAARRRAMKAATDNAEELVKTYTRQANAARQAEITQEISEIVGGADALAAAHAGSE
jgi:F-type H+-transporting ATPase subunit gamma